MKNPAAALALLAACTAADPATPDPRPDTDTTDSGGVPTDSGTPTETPGPAAQDILTTDLHLDLATLTGRATLRVRAAAGSDQLTLDVHGLTVRSVTVDGATVTPTVANGTLSVRTSAAEPVVVVDYAFPERGEFAFDGWMPDLGVSFVWPESCGNLFPCTPSMDDGVTFTMEVVGQDAGLTAIYAADTVSDAPAYMPAIAVGDYTRIDLGATDAGTQVYAWYLPGNGAETDARAGTAHLVGAFDFYERAYGPYPFGPEAGAVSVDWGPDSWGGMEHHPYFHVGKFDFGTEEVHAHEAAHAWFGDGVRIACWEDFVLSEGTVTYMAARAMEETGGPDLWSYYVDDFLVHICAGRKINTVVMPSTCNEIDFLNDDLWSLATYIKGACFYEEVGDVIGPEALDAIVGEFYQTQVTGAAEMEDMIALIEARVDPEDRAAVESAVEDWLLAEACPTDFAERCSAHQAR